LQHSHDFQSYPGGFDTYSFEHLDLFYEEDFQPPMCSNFDEGEVMICMEQDFCDEIFQYSSFPSSLYATKYAYGKKKFLEFKGRLDALRRNLTSHFFSLLSSDYQSSSRFFFIPSQALESDEV
jgi:hypothetical protein